MATVASGQCGRGEQRVRVSAAGMTGIPENLAGLRAGQSEGAGGTMSDLRRIVRDRLRGGVYRLSRKRRAHQRGYKRSTVWQHFRMVEDEQGTAVGYAGCLHCREVLRHDPHATGTSSLFSHLRSCTAHATATASAAPLSPEVQGKAGLAEVTVKEEELEDEDHMLAEDQQQQEPDPTLLEACVDCLALDLLPPRALHSAGFLRLAQLLLECGARDSTAHALALLPSQAQVAARVATRAAEARQHMLGRLAGGAGRRSAALVLCEIPGQQQGPRALLLRTLHEWRLHTHFLGLCPSPVEAERQNPRAEVTTVLKKFHLTEMWEEVPPLVWGGAALADDEGVVPCASRMLGRAVRHLLKAPQEPLPQVREYLDKCRSLVRWAASEDAGLAARLSTDDGDVWAWRRTLAMMEGVCAAGVELWHAGPPCPAAAALEDAALALLGQLAALLQPVRVAAAELEAPHSATLHKVVPWLMHLSNTCQPDAADGATTTAMKAALREGLEQHAVPTSLHRLAVFFNPRMSSLRVFAPEEQRQVRQAVLSMASQDAPPPVEGGGESNKLGGPLAYLEDARPAALSVEREAEVYAIMRDDADPDDLLAWWRRNAVLLPLLAAAAARVLATPACTATSAAASVALENLSDKLLRPPHDDPAHADDLALLHARLAGL